MSYEKTLSPIKTPKTPLVESPMMAFILALIAGCLNGYTYHKIKAFSTLQSGNFILLGESAATGDWEHFKRIIWVGIAFGLGSMTTAFIAYLEEERRKTWAFVILSFEVLLLTILGTGILDGYLTITHICLIISFIAGMQGNAFHKVDGMTYGNVAITPVLQEAFNFLMLTLFGRIHALIKSLIFFYVIAGFVLGGFIGTIATAHFNEKMLFFPALVLLLVLIYLLYAKDNEHEPIDSHYN
ncbi:DUF1275 domain-containing protein [Ignatzschineria indica]|uniref:YoaK family protein n=1 Tax=Ignatzschineria indica TaxID=472583 RepID=UPI002577BBF7|nr:YoaK family protein [Ignatzschineria indica]MDM1545408.1 DUF1275 domain-containing protein [Ignatzschineria indica]